MARNRDVEVLDETTDPIPPGDSMEGLTSGLPDPEDYKTTQATSGPDPVSEAVNFDPAVPLKIEPWEPYPTGNPPPDPHEPRPE